jgi:hypothetical protein
VPCLPSPCLGTAHDPKTRPKHLADKWQPVKPNPYVAAQMIVRKEEEVLSLSGGGDWHMAYLLLYRARTVEA